MAQIAIAEVPGDVSCILLEIAGSSRTVSRSLDVVPGSVVDETLRALPVGDVTFTGSAYDASCSNVDPVVTEPSWLGEPAEVYVTKTPTDVRLVLRRNGRANVTVEFEDDLVSACDPGLVECPDGSCVADIAECDPTSTAVTVYDIQDFNAPLHPAEGEAVTLADVTITAIGSSAMFVQEPEGGAYSGLHVYLAGMDVSAYGVGDSVQLTGTYQEYFNMSQIVLSSINSLGAAPVEVEHLTIAELSANLEPWEGVMVQVENGIVSEYGTGAEYRIAPALLVDDLFYQSSPLPPLGSNVAFVRGPLNFSFDEYKIAPRSADDVLF